MVITVAAVGLNLAACYTLVFGKFGFPALGVAGAGYGTALVSWVMFAALALHVVRSPAFRVYRPFGGLGRLDAPLLRQPLDATGWRVVGYDISAARRREA